MSFLPEVPLGGAVSILRQSYEEILAVFGFLPHFWQAQGARPDIVRASLELWRLIYRTGVLPQALKEEVMLVVSAANSNSYCVIAHLELLKGLGVDKKLGQQIVRNFEATELPEREKALFRFARKVTEEPFAIKESDIVALRQQGWDNAAILELCLVSSHSNRLNRVAAAMGSLPEDVF